MMEHDRRRRKRLIPQTEGFVVINKDYGKTGRIQDIHANGIGFTFMSDGAQELGQAEIEILLSGEDFYLPEVKCKVCYDVVTEHPLSEDSFLHSACQRRCGVSFIELDREQEVRLKGLLKTPAVFGNLSEK
mgnify:CR=1 FL=1